MDYADFKTEAPKLLPLFAPLKQRLSTAERKAIIRSIWQYVSDEKGLRVLTKVESGAGLLTGIARLSAEGGAKRRARESQGGEQQR